MSNNDTITVYEVLADGEGNNGGTAGDGTFIVRFLNLSNAEYFSRHATCWGQPTKVNSIRVPRHIAERWVSSG